MSPLVQQIPPPPVQVGEHRYQIMILDATKGYPLYCKLASQLGKVLEGGGSLESGGKEDLAARMLGKALQALTPELVSELIRAFGAASTVEIRFEFDAALPVFLDAPDVLPLGAQRFRKCVGQPESDELCQSRFIAMWQVTALMPTAKPAQGVLALRPGRIALLVRNQIPHARIVRQTGAKNLKRLGHMDY